MLQQRVEFLRQSGTIGDNFSKRYASLGSIETEDTRDPIEKTGTYRGARGRSLRWFAVDLVAGRNSNDSRAGCKESRSTGRPQPRT